MIRFYDVGKFFGSFWLPNMAPIPPDVVCVILCEKGGGCCTVPHARLAGYLPVVVPVSKGIRKYVTERHSGAYGEGLSLR